jgi:hypothetical protein
LQIGARAAEGLTPNVTFRLGSSFELDRALGSFRLVTMGRSFHWMDRAETLRTLDGMIDSGGAVALFRESHVDVQENDWYQEWRIITARYAKDDPARTQRHDSRWLSHEQVLLSSPFSRLETVSFIGRHLTTVDGLIERARSMSSLVRERIGEQSDQLEQDLRMLLAVSRGRLHYAWNEPREVELNAEIGLVQYKAEQLGDRLQRFPKPKVTGSSPVGTANNVKHLRSNFSRVKPVKTYLGTH